MSVNCPVCSTGSPSNDSWVNTLIPNCTSPLKSLAGLIASADRSKLVKFGLRICTLHSPPPLFFTT
ncbi:Uncharacterised protein [Vibrio cholerae]|nr:Uncharacterised protein [Vibrio cholerae]